MGVERILSHDAFAGIIQIKFNRIISERRICPTCSRTTLLIKGRKSWATRETDYRTNTGSCRFYLCYVPGY